MTCQKKFQFNQRLLFFKKISMYRYLVVFVALTYLVLDMFAVLLTETHFGFIWIIFVVNLDNYTR